jgi:hypothetical protein
MTKAFKREVLNEWLRWRLKAAIGRPKKNSGDRELARRRAIHWQQGDLRKNLVDDRMRRSGWLKVHFGPNGCSYIGRCARVSRTDGRPIAAPS